MNVFNAYTLQYMLKQAITKSKTVIQFRPFIVFQAMYHTISKFMERGPYSVPPPFPPAYAHECKLFFENLNNNEK